MPRAATAPVQTMLPNGVRALVLPMPERQTAAVSVFVRCGSQHEPRVLNGIGHVVEHMVFKGTRTRDAARINLDAESLGAEVNAHTDKDHSAFHLHGLAADATRFVQLLADLLLAPTFPADELERERQVLLQEFAEDEDDPMATAYRLFDHAAWRSHPVAQPAIGRRGNVERLAREALPRWVGAHFTGPNPLLPAPRPRPHPPRLGPPRPDHAERCRTRPLQHPGRLIGHPACPGTASESGGRRASARVVRRWPCHRLAV